MKNTKLLFEMLLVGLIFVTCLFKSRERICAGELQVECVLHKIEICNICQHDFNSSLCSHSKGVLYGGNECTPYEEKYCNICGENIVYCEHEEGVEYGGTECNPWERCNICGNNYYDAGGACSHWKGNSYGGTVCESNTITICNLCGNNYNAPSACGHWTGQIYGDTVCETSNRTVCSVCNDWYSECAHIIGHEYKNIAYYFYIEDRKEQITEDINDLGAIRNNENNEYHQDNKIYAVVEIETNNVNDFISAWDSIGIYKEENDGVYEEEDCCIYAVIMNMHGTETEISNGVGKGYSLRMTLDDINDLERKPVQRLILLQCSAGNIDYVGENVASSFARKVSGKVLAGDKEVHNYKVKPDDSNVKVKIYYVENQKFYTTYYADGRGWYQYIYDWNEEVIRYEYMAPPQIDNMYRIYQLIKMLNV